MKKIMFNDKYGLTQAVLDGRKTMTRRLPNKEWDGIMRGLTLQDLSRANTPFKVGDIVAVAQSYKDTGNYPESYIIDEFHPNIEFEAGWNNKMFVRAELMPHQIRITNVKVERLQDITDEDCIREGIFWDYGDFPYMATKMYKYNDTEEYIHPKAAFAALIDKVSGKGTWESNPWVFVYEFELVK